MAEIQEGDEVRSGLPVVDVVNPATMRVRARVNQTDVRELQDRPGGAGRPRRLPGPVVHRQGRPDFADRRAVVALAESAQLHRADCRSASAHPNLMPDLTASLDVELSRAPGALVVPRDAVGLRRPAGRTCSVAARRHVRSGATSRVGTLNAHEVVVANGLAEGDVVARNVTQGVIR